MPTFTSKVNAKLNLSLEIIGKAKGFHTLKMLICPYPAYSDEVSFIPTVEEGVCEIEVSASFEDFDKSRFLHFFEPKAREIAKKCAVGGKFVVKKGVPLGAGLGGSTASVVAALKAALECARSLGKNIALDADFLLKLGSDAPCMFYGEACIVEGAGEIVKPVNLRLNPSDIHVEIAEGGSDTKACYDLYDKLSAAGENCAEYLPLKSEGWNFKGGSVAAFKNDLTLPAATLNPNIGKLLEKFSKNYEFCVMSGSGSAVLGYKPKFC